MKRQEIEWLLPSVFQRTLGDGSPLRRFLEAMEALHAPAETALSTLDATFDPRRTADPFVPFLAYWLDLERILQSEAGGPATARLSISTGLGRLRELTAAAAWLSKWRGTGRGLLRFLRTATGQATFKIQENVDSAGKPRLFHLVVYAPSALKAHQALIDRIIQSEKPAYVTSELLFRDDAVA